MSNLPKTPQKRKSRIITTSIKDKQDNPTTPPSKQQSACNFITWYKRLIDGDRQSLGLYLSDDVVLEWFGRTVKTRKKVSTFLKYDMQCSKHDFTTVEATDKIQTRNEQSHSFVDTVLASPLSSPELNIPNTQKNGKRKLEICGSPQWADGCNPDNEAEIKCKRQKQHNESLDIKHLSNENNNDISNFGDGSFNQKHKQANTTPPNLECGQGDCKPSTSGTSSENMHETLNGQLPKLAVECNGYIQFTRTRNKRSLDCMKWERKCKVQISYSDDPLNAGEYIIWALRYSDESKCRRNLLTAFEEAAND
ncbi:hypothetical protein KGM_213753 [Danaus plexippus plexippus]|uniref:Uncharacterized protein n=1 Tax=Danaus plexippus plexippus TaxID=278856 RepID=A0A212FE01_DANPL|nr:hypothetical protein KGM_213753 [Danaus plexippus plexippus]